MGMIKVRYRYIYHLIFTAVVPGYLIFHDDFILFNRANACGCCNLSVGHEFHGRFPSFTCREKVQAFP